MSILPDLSLENTYNGQLVAGIDEAGRGPWAGPVVASAVIIDKFNIPVGINDSKKLPLKIREKLYDMITANCHVGVSIISETIIDQVNILEATKMAMREAAARLPIKPEVILVDGNQDPEAEFKTLTVIKGDATSISIAAASIIAKVTRDRIMLELHKLFPNYGWDRNFGYGTQEHMDAIIKYGPSPYHRRSFNPIKLFFPQIEPKLKKNGGKRRMDNKTGWLFEDF